MSDSIAYAGSFRKAVRETLAVKAEYESCEHRIRTWHAPSAPAPPLRPDQGGSHTTGMRGWNRAEARLPSQRQLSRVDAHENRDAARREGVGQPLRE